jgi:hypothetical protein
MPFSPHVKAKLFARCARHCCLCLKQCGTNIEVDHIIPESEGGPDTEDNGIPVCFDCHQEVKAYNDKHSRGNKFRPEELYKRRDDAYKLVESGRIYDARPSWIYLEGVPIQGGAGSVGLGGDANVKGCGGQNVTMIGGSIIGGAGGDGGGKGGDASLQGGDGV